MPVVYDGLLQSVATKLASQADKRHTVTDDVLWAQLTVFYFMLESLRGDAKFASDLDALQPPVLPYWMSVVTKLRWEEQPKFPLQSVLLIIWKCVLCQFGDKDQLNDLRSYVRRKYNLPERLDPNVVSASPLEYHAFREDLISRYPSYVPPPSTVPDSLLNSSSISYFIQVSRPAHTQAANTQLPAPNVHLATPAPSPPMSPAISSGQKLRKSVFMTNQSFPFLYPNCGEVPESIREAGELFASRVHTTPAMVQLWEERDIFMKQERGWDEPMLQQPVAGTSGERFDDPTSRENVVLGRVDRFYASSLDLWNPFLSVVLREMLRCVAFAPEDEVATEESDAMRSKEITLKAITAILDMVLSWFKVEHVLKFEHLATLIVDARYYLIVYKHLYSHSVFEKSLHIVDSPQLSFFHRCHMLSLADGDYGLSSSDKQEKAYTQIVDGTTEIEHFSHRYLFALINSLDVLRRIIKGKTQRVVAVAKLPSEILKKALSVYQEDLWRTTLEIFKEQVPYNGKKWKYNNMDIISAIYLHCKAKLRDDWLSGLDVTAEIDDSYPQELGLRALVQFYNSRKYGYAPVGDMETTLYADFFARQLEAFSLNEN